MFCLGGLGDLLVAMPSMACLRRTLGGRRLVLVCRGEYGGLFIDSGIADEVVPLEGREASFLFRGAGAPPRVRAGNGALAIGWTQVSSRSGIETALQVLGIRTVLISAPDPPLREPLSRSYFADTLAAFPGPGGVPPDFGECSRLHSEKGGMAAARARLGNEIPWDGAFAVIHPGSGGTAKVWPFERFLEISRRLQGAGFPGAFISGEAEECVAISGRLERETLPPGWTWIRKPPVLAVAGLLAGASLYIGNDSGITHLAAACGTSVTALFLEKNVPAWAPYGRSVVLAAESLSDIDTETVWASLLKNLRKL
jgi:lipopolysaccharide heptosyltransferase III